jgi:hypothetical protein
VNLASSRRPRIRLCHSNTIARRRAAIATGCGKIFDRACKLTARWGKCVSFSFVEGPVSLRADRFTLLQVLQLPSFLMPEGLAAELTAARGAVCDDRHSAFKSLAGRGAKAKAVLSGSAALRDGPIEVADCCAPSLHPNE